jgi:hypothetical protein
MNVESSRRTRELRHAGQWDGSSARANVRRSSYTVAHFWHWYS